MAGPPDSKRLERDPDVEWRAETHKREKHKGALASHPEQGAINQPPNEWNLQEAAAGGGPWVGGCGRA